MDKPEKEFWEKFTAQNLNDIEFNLNHGRDEAALKIILCFIDALAGFYVGRRDKDSIEDSWFSFIDREMKGVKKLNLKNLKLRLANIELYEYKRNQRNVKKKIQIIENCCSLLYSIYRNISIHDGFWPDNFILFRSKNNSVWLVIYDNLTEFRIGLNIVEFYKELQKTVKNFTPQLNNKNSERYKKFKIRYDELKSKFKIQKLK